MPLLRFPWTMIVVAAIGIVPSLRAEGRPLRQIIDAEIKAAWEREKVTPAGVAEDAAFLRRVTLDLIGTIPKGEEVARFLKDENPDKRAKVIDTLLDDPRFAAHQADVWDLVLFGRNPPAQEATRDREGFRRWLTKQWAANEPYDRWVRTLLRAEGNTRDEGAPLFLVQFRNQPEEAAVAVSRIFLGTQLQCARCHDHPFDKWQQLDFYGMAGFFVRLQVIEGGEPMKRSFVVAEKRTGEVLFSGSAAEQRPGRKGTPVPPKFLGGDALDEPQVAKDFKEPDLKGNVKPPRPDFSRKEKLAEWIAAADNPYFAKAVANRVWAQFLGRGLVHPIDDLKVKNRASHPALLDELTRDVVDRRFDLKGTIRELVNSETYQLSGKGGEGDALPKWFERARVRPLTAEEMMAAYLQAAGAPEEKLPKVMQDYFVRYFGDATTGRGEFQASLNEHLFLNNSGDLRKIIQRHKGNLADTLLSVETKTEERVERMFLAILGRPPRDAERERFADHLNADPKKTEALVEEAIWALLNSSEFRLCH